MDAKLMVATTRDDIQELKDLLNKQDAITMVVVMSSGEQAPPAAETPTAPMNALLQASACCGSSEALGFLFSREDAQAPPLRVPTQEFLDLLTGESSDSSSNTSFPMHQASSDVEQGAIDHPALLDGVTVEGDTALHVVASHGDGDNFLQCAQIMYDRSRILLVAGNKKGDTPLHCAARAGNSKMVSRLISLARDEDNSAQRLKVLLRKENESKETALHDAVRLGNNQMVKDLMAADPELARFPTEGASPLYLAILLAKLSIAYMLHQESKGIISYSGANGQNALHAAILRSRGFTEMLLAWNKDLTTQVDVKGSTPLHFAAALRPRRNWLGYCTIHATWVCLPVLKANPAALYQPDNDGLFPIHVAASVGAWQNVDEFLQRWPSSAGLRDAKGRTFLHVAVEEMEERIVSRACRNRSLTWILNMQDNNGDTALHRAVKAGSLKMFCALLGNRHVQLNLTNQKGQTPLDVSPYNRLPAGMYYYLNAEVLIHEALQIAGACNGGCRRDHIIENYVVMRQQKTDYESKELEKLRDLTQSLCIGSVLIATVTFGATFALPGGYKADDHTNGGTPTLAGR